MVICAVELLTRPEEDVEPRARDTDPRRPGGAYEIARVVKRADLDEYARRAKERGDTAALSSYRPAHRILTQASPAHLAG